MFCWKHKHEYHGAYCPECRYGPPLSSAPEVTFDITACMQMPQVINPGVTPSMDTVSND